MLILPCPEPQNGRGHYELFNVEMHQEAVNRIELENSIRHDRATWLHNRYHPIIDVESGLTVSAEALSAGTTPSRASSSNHFIPLAEEIGLVKPLGNKSSIKHWPTSVFGRSTNTVG